MEKYTKRKLALINYTMKFTITSYYFLLTRPDVKNFWERSSVLYRELIDKHRWFANPADIRILAPYNKNKEIMKSTKYLLIDFIFTFLITFIMKYVLISVITIYRNDINNMLNGLTHSKVN